jgi:hypothetical protein
VAAAFGPHLQKVTTGTKTEELDQAFASAKAGGFTYLLYPQILHWEDRATEWSAKPDLATVKLSTYTAETGQLLDSAMIDGKRLGPSAETTRKTSCQSRWPNTQLRFSSSGANLTMHRTVNSR